MMKKIKLTVFCLLSFLFLFWSCEQDDTKPLLELSVRNQITSQLNDTFGQGNWDENLLDEIIDLIENDPYIDNAVEAVVKIYNDCLSQNSPVDIDISDLIIEQTPEEEKMYKILCKLLESNSFQEIYSIIGSQVPFSINFKTGNIPQNGLTHNIQSSYDESQPDITLNRSIDITISNNHLNNDSPIQIAQTIAHEMLNAFMFYALVDEETPIPSGVNLENFDDCYNEYVKTFIGTSNSVQHEFMIQELLPILTQITEELLPKLYSQETLSLLESFNHISYWNEQNNTVEGDGSFNFQDFYKWSNIGGSLKKTEWYKVNISDESNNPNNIAGQGDIQNPILYWKIYSYSEKIFRTPSIPYITNENTLYDELQNSTNSNFDNNICE